MRPPSRREGRVPVRGRTPPAIAPSPFPPESWFAAAAGGASRYVVFRDTRGETEFVGAEWEGENVFRVHEHPLRVDGVTLLHYVGDYRHEDGVSVFCIHPDELEAFAGEEGVTLQEMLPGVWAFTDGG